MHWGNDNDNEKDGCDSQKVFQEKVEICCILKYFPGNWQQLGKHSTLL